MQLWLVYFLSGPLLFLHAKDVSGLWDVFGSHDESTVEQDTTRNTKEYYFVQDTSTQSSSTPEDEESEIQDMYPSRYPSRQTYSTTTDFYFSSSTDITPGLSTTKDELSSDISISKSELKTRMNEMTIEKLDSIVEAHKLEEELISSFQLDEIGAYRLEGIYPFSSICDYPNSIHFVDYQNITYYACIADDLSIYFGKMYSEEHQLVYKEAMLPTEIVFFEDNENLYLVIADKRRAEGNSVLQFHPASGSTEAYVTSEHTVNSHYATALAVWKMKSDDNYWLAIANSPEDHSTTYQSETVTYTWKGTYFDKETSVITYDVKDLEVFHIHSSVFLAVANHRISAGEFRVNSEIFEFDIEHKEWVPFQQIETNAASDWEFFSFGHGEYEEFFLIVANQMEKGNERNDFETDSIIYKFLKKTFVPFQCLKTSFATHISTLKGQNGEFVLAISNLEAGVSLYQYNGWEFVKTGIQYTQKKMGVGVLRISTHTVLQDDKYVLAVSNPGEEGTCMFELKFIHENKMKEWHQRSLEWCENMTSIANEHDTAKMKLDFNRDLYFVDQEEDIVIDGDLIFTKDVNITTLVTKRLINKSTGETYEEILLELQGRFDELNRKLAIIENGLKDALLTDGEQEITGEYQFDEVVLECFEYDCHVENIITNQLNGYDIDLFRDVIFTDEKQTLEIPLRVTSATVGSVHLSGTINSLKTSQLVTTTGNHYMTSPKAFLQVHAHDVLVSQTINGLTINKYNVLLTEHDQVITGSISFEEMVIAELTVDGLVDEVNLTKFYTETVLVDGDYKIDGHKEIEKVTLRFDLYIEDLEMNAVNIEELWNSVFWLNENQNIHVSMIFDDISIRGSITTGTINGISIPGPEVLHIDEDIVIWGPKTFFDFCEIRELTVNESINGLQRIYEFSDWNQQLDIMLKTRVQTIIGEKNFSDIHIENSNIVHGLVNGIDLVDFWRRVDDARKSQLNGTSVFNNVIFQHSIVNTKYAYQEKLNKILTKGLKLTTNQIPRIKFVFKDVVHINDLTSHNINHLDVSKDFVLRYGTYETICGEKTFQEIELHSNSMVRGFINGIDLSFLTNVLLVSGNQSIIGSKIVTGNLSTHIITVDGLVNAVDINDVVFLSQNSTLSAVKTFNAIRANEIHIGNLEVEGFLNGIPTMDIFNNSLTYTGTQHITGTKTILGKLSVVVGGNLETGSINGINISNVWEDAVLINTTQTITGRKIFLNEVFFEELRFNGTINGVSKWDMENNWMINGTEQYVVGNLYFDKNVHINGHLLVETVRNIDIVEFERNLLKTDKDNIIDAELIFRNVESYGDIQVSGKIQGIHLSELVKRTEEKLEITGKKRFDKGIKIEENFDVFGLLNNISIDDLCEETIFVHDEKDLGVLTINGDVIFESNVEINGLINGVDLQELNERIIMKHKEKTIYINETVYFDYLTIEGPLTLFGLFCNQNISVLKETYLSRTKDQIITGNFIFKNDVNAGNLQVDVVTTKGLINRINTSTILNTVLTTNGDQVITANLSFENIILGNATVNKINNLKFPEEFMIKGRNNYITSKTVFISDVTITGELTTTAGRSTIQGIHISDWAHVAVYMNGSFDIYGEKHFNQLVVDNIWVYGLLDNINTTNVLIKHGDQTISGKKFIGDVKVDNLKVGTINDISIEDLIQILHQFNKTEIKTPAVFSAPVIVNEIEVKGLLNDWNLTEVGDILHSIDFEGVSYNLSVHDGVILQLQHVIDNQAILLSYYEKVQEFYETYSYIYKPVKIENSWMLLVSINPPSEKCSTVLTYELKDGSFIQSDQVPFSTFGTSDMEVINFQQEVLLIIGNYNEIEQTCSHFNILAPPHSSGVHVFIWNKRTKNFDVLEIIPTNSTSDVEVFHLGETALCVALMHGFGSTQETSETEIYYTEDLENFNLIQILDTKVPHKITAYQYGGQTYLAVANSYDIRHDCNEDSIDIYLWHVDYHKFHLRQNLPTVFAETVLLFPFITSYEQYLFLAVGESRIPNVEHDRPLTIYRYDNVSGIFHEYQKITEHSAVISLKSLVLPTGDLLLFVLTNNNIDNVKIYRHLGASAFVFHDSLTIEGARRLEIFESDLSHYLMCSLNPEVLSSNLQTEKSLTGILFKSELKTKTTSN